MNRWTVVIGLFIVILIAAIVLIVVPGPDTANAPTGQPSSLPDLITVTFPLSQQKIYSPFTVLGQARGTWYFEASAPYQLKNAQGAVIAEGHVDTLGDWMTANFVPFTATITFPAQPAGSVGTLVLLNDNPSGDPANQKELDIPVAF
ncbi:MAG: Gmad2 immunoglobulin-like domain-containing protein [bacterium]|nr:Gmad2 immunoglobulin-like domain-containing protein [bacterium]